MPYSMSEERPQRPYDGDRFGARDLALMRVMQPVTRLLCATYFRLRVEGVEHMPAHGPALFVGNHNNGIVCPEIPCTLSALWDRYGLDAPVYALTHDFAMRLVPPFGALLQRFGAVRASPENGRRALEEHGAKLLVYPGGDLDSYRLTRRRNEVVFGKRTGFVRLARQTGVPIVPVVAHGAHRNAYIFSEGRALAKLLFLHRLVRLERFPIALSVPWGLSLGPLVPYLPLPWPVTLRFLSPIYVAQRDEPAKVREHVREAMQRALEDMAARGRSARRP